MLLLGLHLLKVFRSYYFLLQDLFIFCSTPISLTSRVFTINLGNMTHPVVTRLGVKQFWYNHWYTDNNKASYINQDVTLRKLLSFYLNYGLTTKSSFFVHEYWYNKKYRYLRLSESTNYSITFRRYFYSNNTLSIEHSYLLRNFTGEYFPLKVWLFRYQGWFILSVKWFKPKKKRIRRDRRGVSSHVPTASRLTKSNAISKRFKIITLLVYQHLKSPLNYEYGF